jgi:signal transduction histidine kinase
MTRAVRSGTFAALLAALAALVGSVAWGHWSLRGFLAQAEARRRETSAAIALVGAVALAREAESGQRGYLLTGDDAYLLPYRRAVRQVAEASALVASSGPWPPAEVAALRADLDAKMREMASSVTLAEAGRREEAVDVVRSGRGRRLMGSLRARATRLLVESDRRARARERGMERRARALLLLAPVVAAAAPAVAIASALVAVRQDRARVAAEAGASKARSEAARMAVVLDAISHDVRTPLNAILQYAQVGEALLDEGLREVSPFRHAMAEVVRACRSLDDLLAGYLDVVRAERGTIAPAPLRLASLLADVEQLLRPSAAARELTLATACPPGLSVRSDRAKLKPVLMNLAANAIKFTPSGGVSIDAEAARGGVLLRVADTGPGVPPGLLPRLFEDFVQASNPERDPRKGFGLGLSIAARLAAQVGASIEVESVPGCGTTFTVRVPDLPPDGRAPLPSPTGDA